MPIAKRGFLFTHFEKLLCGVAALLVLAAIVYTALHGSSGAVAASPEKLGEKLREIAQKLQAPARSLRTPDYLAAITDRLHGAGVPRFLRDPMSFPLDQRYPSIRVGFDKEFTLEAREPVKSVAVQGSTGVIEIAAHPVGDDYKKIRLRSYSKEGQALVVAEGATVKHEFPVVVSKEAGKTAHPPSEVAQGGRQDAVTLLIRPNPANQNDGVLVVGYQVWRRDWVDPLGEYQMVKEVGAGEAGGGPVGAAVPAFAPGAAAADTRTRWVDSDVLPGRTYSYKVRTVGSNSYPAAGEFTEPLRVTVSPNVDFQFSSFNPTQVGFDVIREFPGSRILKNKFWVSPGQEIGGRVKDAGTNETLDFGAGAVLVDYHRNVLLRGAGVSDRVIYADAAGDLHIRMRGKTDSELWAMLEKARQPVTGIPGLPAGIPRPAVPTGRAGAPTGAGQGRGMATGGGGRRR